MRYILLLLAVTACLAHRIPKEPEKKKCDPIFCPLIYSPVCGKHKIRVKNHTTNSIIYKEKIFGNLCQMNAENACGGNWTLCCHFEGMRQW
ncbi:unnamed protein product [Nezara viridula]|uniref:Neuropeptide n=1 Tax=Nezara viridula TaxID=85310 RepID=A0A9P0HT23_NEZVI|nr:unnamed protein product [Nezara viridula]